MRRRLGCSEGLYTRFARVGRRCCGLAAGAGDHAALLDVLRARPVAFREAAREEQGVEASCLIATGGDLVWDTQGGNDGFVSLSEFEQLRGEDAVDAFLESELTALVRQGVPLLAFDGEHRQLERRAWPTRPRSTALSAATPRRSGFWETTRFY